MHQMLRESDTPWTREEFEAQLRAQGQSYHHLHPFHQRMNAGELSRGEIRRWVANRFYYQRNIPQKDAAVLANCPVLEVRRDWIVRILDHDGQREGEGGIEAWLRLGEAVGLSRDDLWSERYVLPGVRYAVEAYVNFCRTRPWLEAVAASLTELFGPDAIRVRVEAMERHYPWIDAAGLEYFRTRLTQAPRDARHALGLVLDGFRTREGQERAVAALAFKCDLLWAQLDAIDQGNTQPGREHRDLE